MATTTNYSLPLIDKGVQDWKQAFDQLIEAIDNLLLVNQKPAGLTLQWGDIAGGTYLETNASGLTCNGNINLAFNEIQNLVVHKGASLPSPGYTGQLFYNTATNTISIFNGTSWLALGVSTDAMQTLGVVFESDFPVTAGSFLARNAAGAVAAVSPADTTKTEIAVSRKTDNQAEYKNAEDVIAESMDKGYIRVGTAPGMATMLNPDAVNGKVLTTDSASSAGVKWESTSGLVNSIFTVKGALLSGAGVGSTTLIVAPIANQLLVGDPSTSSGWKLQDLNDIMPQNGAETSTFARVYANHNLG